MLHKICTDSGFSYLMDPFKNAYLVCVIKVFHDCCKFFQVSLGTRPDMFKSLLFYIRNARTWSNMVKHHMLASLMPMGREKLLLNRSEVG